METVGGSEPMVLPMEAKSRGCFAVISSCAARTRNVFRNYSLACRAGCFTSLLVSLGIFASHGLFLWAQWGGANHDCILGTEATHCSGTHMQPGLLKGEIVSHVDFEAGNLLSLLTTLVEGKLCPGPQMLERCPDGEHTQITEQHSLQTHKQKNLGGKMQYAGEVAGPKQDHGVSPTSQRSTATRWTAGSPSSQWR